MAIEFICPSCQGTLSMADDAAGKLVRCGSCLATLRVPEAPVAQSRPPAYEEILTPLPVEREDENRDRDEYGEPRPRSRRTSTGKKRGRGPLFWIIIILFGLGLFTCVACGGIMALLAKARWVPHNSAEGEYTVDFPAAIHPNIAEDAKLDLKKDERVEGAVLAGRLEFYWVWWKKFEMDGRPRELDKVILDKTVERLTEDGKGTVLKETPRTVDGFTAREVVLGMDEGQTHHCLIVVGKSKLYVVAAGGPFVNVEGNSRIRRFLDSFHLKNPGAAE